MPTGYTAKLMEEGQTFQEFVMTCARAFGYCSSMRDAPFDQKIPVKFEPNQYNLESEKKAKDYYKKLISMTEEQKIDFGIKKKQENIISIFKESLNVLLGNLRLEEMNNHVTHWVPPTEDHRGLRDFMLEQIRISKSNEHYYKNRIAEVISLTPIEHYREALDQAEHDIKYFKNKIKEEIKGLEKSNVWLSNLRNSIKE